MRKNVMVNGVFVKLHPNWYLCYNVDEWNNICYFVIKGGVKNV